MSKKEGYAHIARHGDHSVSKWIEQEGYTKKQVRTLLRIDRRQFKDAMRNPARYLTIHRIMILSTMLRKRDLQEILQSILQDFLTSSDRESRGAREFEAHEAYIDRAIKIREKGGKEMWEF
jgi:predicted XRE-type DNA-binding protein